MNQDLGIEFKLTGPESMSLVGDIDAYAFFFIVSNMTQMTLLVGVDNATYVKESGEQLQQDKWLTGYLVMEEKLRPGAYRKAGLLFYKEHLPKVSPGDYIYLEVAASEIRKRFVLKFVCVAGSRNYGWKLAAVETNEIDSKPSPKQLARALTKRVERLEAIEERFGIQLDKIVVRVDDPNTLRVLGELYKNPGAELPQSFKIVVALYDDDGFIIETRSEWYSKDEFSGYTVFEYYFSDDNITSTVSRIRVFAAQ